MKVFISWSGPSEGKVAQALRDALHSMSTGSIEAFVSNVDIPRGERGIPMIEDELASTNYGIVVLSAENKDRPWINYEGGALATAFGRRVATVLLDLRTAEVDTPLAVFQATIFSERQSVFELLSQIALIANPKAPPEALETLFDAQWDKIQESWEPDASTRTKRRTERDMLEEVVNGLRTLSKNQRTLADTVVATFGHAPKIAQSGRTNSARGFADEVFGIVARGTGGRVYVTTVHRLRSGWRVALDGESSATRDDFEFAHFLVQDAARDHDEVVVTLPIAPGDPSEGLLGTDTLGEVRAGEARQAQSKRSAWDALSEPGPDSGAGDE
jgi:hypothetical protein